MFEFAFMRRTLLVACFRDNNSPYWNNNGKTAKHL